MRYNLLQTLRSFTPRIIVCLSLLAFPPSKGGAQTLLAWPDTQVDVGKYEHLETCMAMIQRVRDSVYVNNDTLRDTLPSALVFFEHQPVYMQTMAQRCLARFQASSNLNYRL